MVREGRAWRVLWRRWYMSWCMWADVVGFGYSEMEKSILDRENFRKVGEF